MSNTNTTEGQSPHDSLSNFRRIRVLQLLQLLSISKATFYARLKAGHYPKPDGYDGKMPYWHQKTAYDFLSSIDGHKAAGGAN